jgi:hypothetical protein
VPNAKHSKEHRTHKKKLADRKPAVLIPSTIGFAGGGPLVIGCASHADKRKWHSTTDYARVVMSFELKGSQAAPKRPVGVGSRQSCRGDFGPSVRRSGYGRARRRVRRVVKVGVGLPRHDGEVSWCGLE